MSQPVTERGTLSCRCCASPDLVSVLDLGDQPLSNEMVLSPDGPSERFPLHLRLCTSCGLGQVGEYVLPERIFGEEYPYLSSTSSSWVEHARRYAADFKRHQGLGTTDLVVEIASNDGYLLSAFQGLGTRVLGIEPARNVAALAIEAGVPTINEFFGAACAARIVADHGHPRLVAANNVMAHVPDINDFVAGLAALCDDDTLVTVENPSFLTLLKEAQFDTIYHEHFSYLTAHAVREVADRHGMQLVRVEKLPTHGGSNRYFLRPAGAVPVDDTVNQTLEEEERGGLFEKKLRESFAARSYNIVHGLREWLDQTHASGARMAAYGAAAKGNTLLNAVGAQAGYLTFAVDASAEKQGKYLPGSLVPVYPPEHLRAEAVDDVLVLPWNLAAELKPIVHALAPEARVWVPRPQMERLQ